MNKKYIILFLFLLTMSIPLHAIANESLILLLNNGRTASFAFEDNPVIITGEQIVLTSQHVTINYDYSEVKRFYWASRSTKIDKITNNKKHNVTFYIYNNNLKVSGLNEEEKLSIYNVSGKKIKEVQCHYGTENMNISIPVYKGVFLLHTSSGITYKFQIK